MLCHFLIMDPKDNVAVVLAPFEPGDVLELPSGPLVAHAPIPLGHKIATREIPGGDYVVKYGVPIGRATSCIAAGAHVHTHNVLDITEEVYALERKKLNL